MSLRSLWIVPLFAVSVASADNWPQWRGPRSDGTVTDTGLPTQWTASENVVWKCAIPGKGHSSPIVWGKKVFLTTCIEGEPPVKGKPIDPTPRDRILYCIDRDSGKIIWQKIVLQAKQEKLHKLNSCASSTPATDGERVYVTFLDEPKLYIVCYDMDGTELWRKSPGDFKSQHGFCAPPVLYQDRVIVNADQDAVAYIVAFDKKTGDERWRINRPNRTRSYSPPIIVEAAGRKQLVLSGSKSVASYDPDTGKQHWLVDGPTEQFVAGMIYHKNLFILTAGFPTYHVMAIKPDGSGNVTKSHVAWHEVKGAGYVPSPVAFGDYVFLVHDNGLASCRDATTGELKWAERLGKHHSASPIVADGKIYYPDDDGTTWIVKASPTYELIAKNPIGEELYASPAVADGQLFLRGAKHLYRIDAPKGLK